MKKYLLSLAVILLSLVAFSQPKPAYVLYTADGKKANYGKMIQLLSSKDVVLIGEYHNNAISHWMELEITNDCQQKREVVLGAEMFEQDNQNALNQYLAGKLTAKGLDTAARLWKNYPTDYAPLVNFAKEKGLAFVATNVPRKYASMVSKGGFETLNNLTAEEKSWLAPLPIAYDPELPGYKNMMAMMAGHGTPNMPKAQALKDAEAGGLGYFEDSLIETGKGRFGPYVEMGAGKDAKRASIPKDIPSEDFGLDWAVRPVEMTQLPL